MTMKKLIGLMAVVNILSLLFAPFPGSIAAAGLNVGINDFKNLSGDPKLDRLEKEIARVLEDRLSKIKAVVVVREEIQKEKILKGEKILTANILVRGSIQRDDSRVVIDAKLFRLEDSVLIFAERVSGKNIKVLKGELADNIADKLEEYAKTEAKPPEEMEVAVGEVEGEFQIVQVKSRGKATSRRAALIVAQRNAVEKGVGAVVSLNQVPDRRQIISETMGGLSYEIISEGTEGSASVVEIQARVKVPRELMKKYPVEAVVKRIETGFKPYIEPSKYGQVNFEELYVTAWGEGKYKGKGTKARQMARRAAIVDAQAHALEIVHDLRVDASKKVKDDKDKIVKIKGLVKDAEVIDEKDMESEGKYQVTIRVPLVGIRGISSVFLDEKVPTKKGEIKKTKEAKEDAYTGLIIDARGTGLKPAMFPQIEDEDGNLIYGPEMVDKQTVKEQGMASYAIAEKDGSLLLDEKTLYIKARARGDYHGPAILVADLSNLMISDGSNGLVLAEAEEEKGGQDLTPGRRARRARLRQGGNPMEVKALKSGGKLKANVIVSSESAQKAKLADEASQIFTKCKVVILMDTMIGGTEGKIGPPGSQNLAAR
jgi:TolB-like protein